jgi:hypothetical protein
VTCSALQAAGARRNKSAAPAPENLWASVITRTPMNA